MKRLSLVAVVLGTTVVSVHALHRQTPPLQLLSNSALGTGGTVPGFGDSAWPTVQGGRATYVGFHSSADLKNLGGSFAGGQQVFMFENDPDGGRHLYQVTNKAGISGNASVTSTGKIVAFDSDARLLNLGLPGVKQIYTWDIRTGQYAQWTNGTADSFRPLINSTGTSMIFLSKADLNRNGSSGTHVFLWRQSGLCIPGIGCGNPLQLTPPGNWESDNPVFSPNAGNSWILFNSNAPIDGPANGRQQCFALNRLSSQFDRLTNFTSGDCRRPTIDVTGRWVTFESNADPVGNGSNGWEIFLLDRDTREITQITNHPVGDSTEPSIGFNANYVSFVSTADLVGNGSTGGPHLFVYDLRTHNTYQFTRGEGNSHHPLSTGNSIFFFDSTADPMHIGNGYRQVYSLNVFNWLPGANLGLRTFPITKGTPDGGSRARVLTGSAETVFDLDEGEIEIAFGARNIAGEASLSVNQGGLNIPPIPMPDFGAICLEATGNGAGQISCNGGHDDLDVSVTQDHYTDDSDPFCLFGCREGESCQGPLPGPNLRECTMCSKRCLGGTHPGLACTDDAVCGEGGICHGECTPDSLVPGLSCTSDPDVCNPIEVCEDRLRGICRGPQVLAFDNNFGPGAAKFSIPIAAKLSNNPGPDSTYCTADDTYPVTGLESMLYLTTGSTTRRVYDADNQAGVTIETTETGFPFDCDALMDGNFNGATFVGSLHYLNMPNALGKFQDVILGLSFQSGPCTTNCPIPCQLDSQCDDGNVCTGEERCGLDGYCKAGEPIQCSDGDACNGIETCNPADGSCQAGTAPNCDDANLCTADSCVPSIGCKHVEADCGDGDACNGAEICNPTTGLCDPGVSPVCDDGNPCNGAESCAAQIGCIPGAPIHCSDGNACNGLEACDPMTGTCTAGSPLTCDDGNSCNGVETCDFVAGCRPGTPISCSNGNPCDGTEVCDSGSGSCVAGTPLVCDDAIDCTVDSCSASQGCLHELPSGYPGPLCVVMSLDAQLHGGTASSSIAPKVLRRWQRTAERVIARIQSAQRATPKFAFKHTRQALRQMNRLARDVSAAESIGKCGGAICDDIKALAGVVTGALQPMLVRP